MSLRVILSASAGILFILIVIFASHNPVSAEAIPGSGGEASPREAGLEECLQEALKNSHRRPASRYAVEMAEAQHRQALAGYWPQIGVKGGYQRVDQSPNFLFPATQIHVPAGSAAIMVPAQLVNPAAPPGAMIPLPVSTPAQDIAVPAQDIKLMDENSYMASLEATWLLYDGGGAKAFGNRPGASSR